MFVRNLIILILSILSKINRWDIEKRGKEIFFLKTDLYRKRSSTSFEGKRLKLMFGNAMKRKCGHA